jgi:RNA polymerase sigma factor (sigma-70 family)
LSKNCSTKTFLAAFPSRRVFTNEYQMTDTQRLLADYVTNASEPAFRELVTRYLDLVYSTAVRLVSGDTHRAQDVAQTVFIDLARKAPTLPTDVMLGGWLHRHTCFVASKIMRGERRRQFRESQAVEMNALQDPSEANLTEIAPILDEAINQLGDEDRTAILLRFFEQRDLRAVGEALGSSENAAQKRVTRALEELRTLLKHRGVASSAAALGTVLASEAVTAAPAGLAGAISSAVLAGTTAATTTATITKAIAMTTLQKTLVTALVVASVAAPFAVQHQAPAGLREQEDALRTREDQLAKLQAENEAFSNQPAQTIASQPNGQSNESLRLRDEIAHLQGVVQELTGPKTAEPLSREEVLDSLRQLYSDRVNRLKQLFAANPAEAVPELRYLTDADWIQMVMYDHHRIDPDDSHAMSLARGRAQQLFASELGNALRKYGNDNNGQFPTDLSQLTSYFKSPVDDVLQGWMILPGGSLPSSMRMVGEPEWVITQKAPINAELDQRWVVAPNGIRTGREWGTVP